MSQHRRPFSTTVRPHRLRPLARGVRLALSGGMLAGWIGATAAELPVPQENWTTNNVAREVVGATMNITQREDRVKLNWKSFDIGRGNTVNFRQPNASAIALNKVDASGRPSQILGALNANGQVYLVNPDGVVFGAGSQVNVGALVATNLKITDEVLQKGLTKGGNVGKATDSYAALNGDGALFLTDPATGAPVLDAAGNKLKIQVVVEKGALIKANAGGRVIIAAPEVRNEGQIETPNGQTILAGATDKVYLKEDTNLGGLLVEVGTGGKVDNLGTVLAKQGNATLLGFAVNQQGRVSASTSVRVGGSVRLLAREGGQFVDRDGVSLDARSTTRAKAGDDGLGTTARVSVGPGSTTEATPDLTDTATAGLSEAQPKSKIEIQGEQVHLGSLAKVTAPSGQIDVQANDRLLIGSGATVDAAGLKRVKLSVARNYLQQDVRKNELRDSPLQRDGVLYAKIVQFDRRKQPTIVDVSGAVSRYTETVAERSTVGGTVSLSAGNELVLQRGSKVDVSGGSLAYQSAKVFVSQLVDARGRRVNIEDADPNVRYRAVLGEIPRAGQTVAAGSQAASYVEPGYVEGKAGGRLTLSSSRLLADGSLTGATDEGLYQREAAARPAGAQLTIDLTRSVTTPRDVQIAAGKSVLSDGMTLDTPYPEGEEAGRLNLTAAELEQSAFRHVALKTLGNVRLAAATAVRLPTHGSLSVDAAGLTVDGTIDIPSGSFDAKLEHGTAGATLGAGAAIDVSGAWTNERPPYKTGTQPLALDAGSVSIRADGDVTLAAGSAIRANAGVWLDNTGKNHLGKAGSIGLAARGPDGSNLTLGGTLQAFGFSKGGSLSLESNAIRVSNQAPTLVPGERLQPLWLTPAFFHSGFQSYQLTANLGDAVIAGDAQLDLTAVNWRLPGRLDARSRRSADALVRRATLTPYERNPVDFSLSLQQLPARVSAARSLTIEQGAVIAGDRGAHLSFSSDTRIRVDGLVKAPAGRIDMKIVKPTNTDDFLGFLPNQGIFLGATARLEARGMTVAQPNRTGYRFLDIYDGGSVSLKADQGSIVAVSGSSIDVSGVSDWYHQRRGINPAAGVRRRNIATAGGSIELSAPESLLIAAALQARGGNATRPGGRLLVSLDGQLRQDRRANNTIEAVGQKAYPVAPGVMRILGSDGLVVPDGWIPGDDLPPGVFREARVSARRLEDAGFSDLQLTVFSPADLAGQTRPQDAIRFEGTVALSAANRVALSAPLLTVAAGADGSAGEVRVSARYLRLGSDLIREAPNTPVSGNGRFVATANTLDLIGGVSLDGVSSVTLATIEDIRAIGVRNDSTQRDFRGEFVTAADLVIQARQLYPTTLTQFRLASLGDAGRVAILPQGSSADAAPLSAAGRLTLEAATIEQRGTVRAPFGTIEFRRGTDADGRTIAADSLILAPGSLTSVSGAGLTVPFGRTVESAAQWLYPLFNSDQSLTITAPPEKQIALTAQKIDLAAGSTVDLSGGGELSAYEFLGKGPGGSVDVVAPDGPQVPVAQQSPYAEKYAILPKLKASYLPVDPLEFPLVESHGLSIGKTLHLTGAGGLPTGDYVLLPARYALLPGAYLITPVAAQTHLLQNQVIIREDGVPIAAGYTLFGGSGNSVASGYWQGYAIQPGGFLRQQSELLESTASAYFAAAGKSPADAGQLSLNPTRSLTLNGTIAAQAAAAGRAGSLDIAADVLKIVLQASAVPTDGIVELTAADLGRLGGASVLLGGKRRSVSDGTAIDVLSDEVVLESGVDVAGSEILIAAKDRLALEGTAAVRALGTASSAPKAYLLEGSNAFLRAAAGSAVELRRVGESGGAATLRVAADARIAAPGAIALDSTGDVELLGRLEPGNGALSLGGAAINLGNVPAGTSGLNLTQAFLSAVTPQSLSLRSSNPIRTFGATAVSASSLTLDAPGISGFDNAGQQVRLSAARVELRNSNGAAAGSGNGSGSLQIDSTDLVFGNGSFAVDGFSTHTLTASHMLRGEGEGTFRFAGALTLSAPILLSAHGATTTVDAGAGALTLDAGTQPVDASLVPGWGAKWAFNGRSIRNDSRIVSPSGSVGFTSAGAVEFGQNARVDVAARGLAYQQGKTIAAPGGTVSISALGGDITLAAGSQILLAGLTGLSDGGSLTLSVPAGRFLAAGTISASAGADFTLDAGQPSVSAPEGATQEQLDALGQADFARLVALWRAGGFDDRISYRLRNGDLIVTDGGQPIKAHDLTLVADHGALTVDGAVDLSGTKAGRANFWSSGALRLTERASIKATATGAGEAGGAVILASMRSVTTEDGARIDVGGGQGGEGGSVTVRAPRTANGSDVAAELSADLVTGAATRRIEGFAVYTDPVSNANLRSWRNAAETWTVAVNNDAAVQQRLHGFTAVPGIEVQASGTLNFGLTDVLAKAPSWSRVGTTNVWTAKVSAIGSTIVQRSADGTERVLTAATNRSLSRDGTYFIDQDPQSANFGLLYVRVFPDSSQTGANRYDPRQIRDTVLLGTTQSRYWSRVGTTNVWSIGLGDVAGAVTSLSQTATDGSIRTLTPGTSATLNRDGTFFFDTDPRSATYRRLFVQVFADSSQTGIFRYSPDTIQAGLSETNGLDFALPYSAAGWRFGPEGLPATFTLRVAGDLAVKQSISDGFAPGYVPDVTQNANNRIAQYLQAGESTSFRLVSGADLGSANPLAVVKDAGDFTVASGIAIRTGTGSIDIASGGDFKLTDQTSVVYTAGRPDGERYGKFDKAILERVWYAEFPTAGGDISIQALGDIQGAVSSQLISNWLVRLGNFGSVDADHPAFIKRYATAWGIAFDASTLMRTNTRVGAATNIGFQQNVGALGGGNVSIRAGGSVRDLTVVIPTTGKPIGTFDEAKGEFVTNEVQVQGGGNLNVESGADVNGGLFFVDGGEATIRAGGSIGGGTQYAEGPVVALGDATVTLTARQDLSLSNAIDPYWVDPFSTVNPAYFSRYTERSGLNLLSVGGDLTLANDTASIRAGFVRLDANREPGDQVIGDNNAFALWTYPGTLKAYAASGKLVLKRSVGLFPSASGQLELVGYDNVESGTLGQGDVFVTLSDVDRAFLPDATRPISTVASLLALQPLLDPNPAQQSNAHALDPVHRNDPTSVVIASLTGGITGATAGHDPLAFTLAKPLLATAAGDIAGVTFRIQHHSPLDVSSIRAGGDIRYETVRNPLTGELSIVEQRIEVAGPGNLNVIAGKSVDLGTSDGILSIGNRDNSALPDTGASLNIFAALPKGLDFNAFVDTYLKKDDFYKADLALYVERTFFTANGSARDLAYASALQARYPGFAERLRSADESVRRSAMADAVELFESLTPDQQVEFVTRVVFSEVRLSSTAAAVRAGQVSFSAALERLQIAAWKKDMDGSASVNAIGLSGMTLESRLKAIVDRPKNPVEIVTPSGEKRLTDPNAFVESETAIDTAFNKDAVGRGDIRMFYSTIQTLDGGTDNESVLIPAVSAGPVKKVRKPAGGPVGLPSPVTMGQDFSSNDSDINLITLGGLMNLGLASTSGGAAAKSPDQLGVIVKRDGSANALVSGDFLVNRSRFVANSGGDVIIYSRNADIDAGLGSNSEFAAQEEIRSFDAFGMFKREVLPSVSGSGPQANAPDGERRGNVFLGVPKGVVNISEAGITGDSILAPALVGNTAFVSVSVSGSSGSSVAVAAPSDVGSIAANAARAATDSVTTDGSRERDDKNRDKEKSDASKTNVISADLVGFGSCSVNDVRDGKAGCGGGES